MFIVRMSTATGDRSQKEENYENHQNKSKEVPKFVQYKWWIQIAIY